MLPVVLSEGVNKGRLSLGALQRVCCENPARIFGLASRKGTIGEGADADLVIVDMRLKRKVRAKDLHQKVDWTPYEGRVLKGWPVLTMRKGQVVFQDAEVLGRPGNAEFLPMNL
jgi:dihydropyrimidinase